MDNQPFTPDAPVQERVIIKEKTKSRPAVVVLSILLLLSLVGLGLLGYFWYQEKQSVSAAEAKTAQANAKYEALNQVNIGQGQADQTVAKMPNFGTFNAQYNNFIANGVNVDQTKEKADIEAALKSYYDVSSLPAGWDVLSIYQVVKPETPPTGDYYALVYWPKTNDKPAGFISLEKTKGGSWKYDDRR